MRVTLVVVAFLVLGASSSSHAARPRTATVSVEITGASWQHDALATALREDLADEVLRAPAAGTPAELVVRGELASGQLRYAIWRGGVAPIRGVIELGGLDRPRLAGILRDALHRIVQPGESTRPGAPAALAEPELGGALGGLALLAGLLVMPLVVGAVLLRRRALRLRGMQRVAIALAGVAGLAYAMISHRESIPELGGVVMLAGGLAWGAFAAVALPVALPSVFGLHRVEHAELVPVLRAWFALAVQRTLAVAAVFVPIGIVVGLAGDALELPAVVTFGVISPVVALAVRLAWRAITEVVATRLDGELVDGDASELQPWHLQARAYFVGYLHRANLTVDAQLLERVRFLPGREPEIAVYGGGLTHTRVVIPRAMLEQALAPYGRPHDYAMPRVSTLHWTHWGSGVVMPTEPGARLATREDRKPHVALEEGGHERIALGEPPTLSGIIEPAAFDPRTSYRPAEDPLWLDWDPGEEFDGTDAGDKDFLFGVLVHAMGSQQRHEDRAAAIGLAVRRSKRRLARLVARACAPVAAFAARRTARLGDAYVALGGARHHLAQYLAWLLWRRDDLLTARAHVPELEQTSRKILAALEAEPAGDPALRRRLDGLRLFLERDHAPTRARRRRLVLACSVLVGLAAVAAVAQAVLYHPTHEARTSAEHERLDDGK